MSGAQSFIETFQRVYNSTRDRKQDHQWLQVYYAQGVDRIRVSQITKSISGDNIIIIINGFDLSGNECVVVSRVEAINFVMKFEQKEENREYTPIGF